MLEDLPRLSILPFFSMAISCYEKKKKWDKKYQLPSNSSFFGEEEFAKVLFAWDPSSLFFQFTIDNPLETEEDFVEIFIDTRDLKTKSFPTKFCHHFLFIPLKEAREVTKFRSEDAHVLCDPKDLVMNLEKASSGYSLDIQIPAHCLHGFDPEKFTRFGFSYIVHRSQKSSQHFVLSSEEFTVEQNPSFWCSVTMEKE
jgi:hypothetical protein